MIFIVIFRAVTLFSLIGGCQNSAGFCCNRHQCTCEKKRVKSQVFFKRNLALEFWCLGHIFCCAQFKTVTCQHLLTGKFQGRFYRILDKLARRAKPIRIIGGSDNQRPDYWSSTVLALERPAIVVGWGYLLGSIRQSNGATTD